MDSGKEPVKSVNDMKWGDQTISGRLYPYLTFDEREILKKKFPTVKFSKGGTLYSYKKLDCDNLNMYSMNSVTSHVSFITGQETQVIIQEQADGWGCKGKKNTFFQN